MTLGCNKSLLIFCAPVLALFLALQSASAANPAIRLQLLVIGASETDSSFQEVKALLDYVGVPYATLIANNQILTPESLSDASGGKYQGIILATDSLGYNGASTFEASEWQILRAYEAAYRIRQVTYFTYPGAAFGLSMPIPISTDQSPLYVRLTPVGEAIFPYLKSGVRIPLRNAYTYLAKPVDGITTSLVEDDAGNAIVSLHTYLDGRENLAITCANRRNLVHSKLLNYGIIDWVTRGLHLGERSVYLTPQVDDIFLANWLFDTQLGAISTTAKYRLSGSDMQAYEEWQNQIRNLRDPSFGQFTLTLAFNGYGVLGPTDTLLKYFEARQDLYNWVNHTYSHLDMDVIDYSGAVSQILLNHQFALNFPFHRYKFESLITGGVLGLANPEAMRAMADTGIKYIVGDASRPEHNNPRPNLGVYNALAPSILQIPRHPTSLFTSGSTVEEAVGHYNSVYRSYWGRDLTYQEIIDRDSDQILGYMLSYDMDPLMFHQGNMRAYDGLHSLLSDLMDNVIRKYSEYMTLPVLSPAQELLGERMAQRMAWQEAGVEAEWIPDGGIRLRAKRPLVLAVSGIAFGSPAGIDTIKPGTYRSYGGKPTSWVQLEAEQPLWIPLSANQKPAPRRH